jgi:hypothetical protein
MSFDEVGDGPLHSAFQSMEWLHAPLQPAGIIGSGAVFPAFHSEHQREAHAEVEVRQQQRDQQLQDSSCHNG